MAYEALLAECYDTLHKARRTVNVITSTSPHEDPGRFLLAAGAAYRASGRTAPLFDTLGHNAYPETSRESPLAVHAGVPSLDQGDYVAQRRTLARAEVHAILGSRHSNLWPEPIDLVELEDIGMVGVEIDLRMSRDDDVAPSRGANL